MDSLEELELLSKYEQVTRWIESQAAYKKADTPFLSLVIPAYREEQRLPGSILKMKDFFSRFPLPIEVLIMIEKSPDRTLEVSREAVGDDARFQVIDNVVQRGKGYAVRSGMMRAAGDFVLFMDADLSTPLYEIIHFLDYVRKNPDVDVLIADRQNARTNVESRSWHRRVMSHSFNQLMRTVSSLEFTDTQAGFKLFRQHASEKIFRHQTLDRFAFDVEVLILANELGMRIDALDVDWIDDERSTVHPVYDSLRMLRDVIGIHFSVKNRLRSLKGNL